jgi:hypothetical protein
MRGLATLAVASVVAVPESPAFTERFDPGWEERWMVRRLKGPSARFDVVEEDGNPVLRVESREAASGLWHMTAQHAAARAGISWRWKVERPLSGNRRERKKSGDDYAARLFVVFEPALFDWRTRALCYVWAGNEPAGSVYPSPRAGTVGTFVLQGGTEHAGQWVREERDYVADYRNFFGEEPEMISAIAIMVDTDDTGSSAITYFDDLSLY